jgi:hypothetical protein
MGINHGIGYVNSCPIKLKSDVSKDGFSSKKDQHLKQEVMQKMMKMKSPLI